MKYEFGPGGLSLSLGLVEEPHTSMLFYFGQFDRGVLRYQSILIANIASKPEKDRQTISLLSDVAKISSGHRVTCESERRARGITTFPVSHVFVPFDL